MTERSFGLGPLEPLLRDPSVDEVMVFGAGDVWVERAGRLERAGARFAGAGDLRHAIERILAPLGRRVDESEPLCDARLPDGSRVNVVIPPLALDGPALTIRRFRPRGLGPEDLVACGTWSPALCDLLRAAVAGRRSILVSGGTGSGKTTTLNALSAFVAEGERIVTIEDTAELRLRQPHVVRLEARPPNVEGRGEVTIRRLVRNALRMRPDRIVVGEVRGAEALDMLSAMTTGHDGSLSTVHAGSPAEALRRIETLALMADVGLPHAAIRELVADAVDLVVHQARMPDGSRRVVAVSEVVRVAGARRRASCTWRTPGARRRERRDACSPAPRPWRGVWGAWELFAAIEQATVARAVRGARGAAARRGARWPGPRRERATPDGARLRRLGAGGWLAARRAVRGAARGGRRARGARPGRAPPAGGGGARRSRRRPRGCACARRRARGRPLDPRRARGGGGRRRRAGGGGRGAPALRPCPARSASAPRRCSATCAPARRTRPGTRSSRRSCCSATPAATSRGCCVALAAAREEAARVEAEARGATTQARFTAGSCRGLPLAAAALVELASPGATLAVLASPPAALMVAASIALQATAWAAVRRISRVAEGAW